jgi:hypothetical protein
MIGRSENPRRDTRVGSRPDAIGSASHQCPDTCAPTHGSRSRGLAADGGLRPHYSLLSSPSSELRSLGGRGELYAPFKLFSRVQS